MPLFKRGSVSRPDNYRDVHFSSIIFKTVERVIVLLLIAFLEKRGHGKPQWAFRKHAAARDLIIFYAAKWVLSICGGRKIGMYLSGISEAFDKVSRTLLIGKLSQIDLTSTFLDFLNSYLLSREGKMAVEGTFSEAMFLCSMVFQGTVLGPALWNAFFGHVITFGLREIRRLTYLLMTLRS